MKKTGGGFLAAGDVFYWGSYPQNLVDDEKTAAELDRLCGAPKKNRAPWKQYDYIYGCALYADVIAEAKKYRCVYLLKSRNEMFGYEYSDYIAKRVYRFSYDPIAWRVLKIENGIALCVAESILDASEYFAGDTVRNLCGKEVYQNNYRHSAIRLWLNGAFFETAFTERERLPIIAASVKNGAETTKCAVNPYACEDTLDKVFLLSFQEAQTLFCDNRARQKKATEYAKSQDCSEYRTRDEKYNNAVWWLRSPHHKYCNDIRCVGIGGGLGDGGFSTSGAQTHSHEGVVPAIRVRLDLLEWEE